MPRTKKLPPGMHQRGRTYYARFSKRGRLIRERLSTNYEAAVEILNDLKARADRADYDLLDNNYPLEDLKDHWLRHCQQTLRESSVKRYVKCLNQILPALPARKVSQLTVKSVLAYRDARLAEHIGGTERLVTPRTVNMEVGALCTMLNWGLDHRLIGSNPIAGVKPLPHEVHAKQRRSLSADEVGRIFQASPAHLLPVWRMFMTTAIRRGELVAMTFDHVDFENRSVTVRASSAKNRKPREIPLDDAMFAEMVRLRDEAPFRRAVPGRTRPGRLSKDHVFVTGANTPWRNASNLLRAFYGICAEAGIEGAHRNGSVDIHSLRVSFATLSIDNGASPKAVQAILGHSTLGMTMNVYTKATQRSKRDAVSALPYAQCDGPEHVIALRRGNSAG